MSHDLFPLPIKGHRPVPYKIRLHLEGVRGLPLEPCPHHLTVAPPRVVRAPPLMDPRNNNQLPHLLLRLQMELTSPNLPQRRLLEATTIFPLRRRTGTAHGVPLSPFTQTDKMLVPLLISPSTTTQYNSEKFPPLSQPNEIHYQIDQLSLPRTLVLLIFIVLPVAWLIKTISVTITTMPPAARSSTQGD